MVLAYCLLGGSALFLIYHDIRTQTIPLYGILAFVASAVLNQWYAPDIQGLWSAVLIVLAVFISQGLFFLFKGRSLVGTGDIVLCPFCGLWIRMEEIPVYFLLAGSVALLMGVIWRYRWKMPTYPLSVALLLGLGGTLLMRCFFC